MKHFGFLIPASNIVAEKELYTRLIKDNKKDVYFHFARLKFKTPYGENEEKYTKELVDSIPTALSELDRIKTIEVSVLCTSAEIYYSKNDDLIFPLASVISYLKSQQVSRPLIISPYNSNIGMQITQRLREAGIAPQKELHLNIKTKEDLLLFSKHQLLQLIEKELEPNIDSICVLCTNFATQHLEADIENTFKLPFISSNKAIYLELLKWSKSVGESGLGLRVVAGSE